MPQAELSDGLPLVVPTAERIGAMLEGVRKPDTTITQMPPLLVIFGRIRWRIKVSLPVANRVLCRCWSSGELHSPEFNLLGLLTTTGTPAVALVVHGKPSHSLA